MTRKACFLAAVTALLAAAGCHKNPPKPDPTPDPEPGEVRMVEYAETPDDVDFEACERIDRKAQEFLASRMICSSDTHCETWRTPELLGPVCLPSLACYVAISTIVDQRVLNELRELDETYRRECGLCPTAVCIDQDRIFSTCEADSCVLDVAPEPIDDFTI